MFTFDYQCGDSPNRPRRVILGVDDFLLSATSPAGVSSGSALEMIDTTQGTTPGRAEDHKDQQRAAAWDDLRHAMISAANATTRLGRVYNSSVAMMLGKMLSAAAEVIDEHTIAK
jgi:hypothetical protein